MCKKSLLMMLLLALFAPWAANAQNEYEVQIGEGTSTTGYFPFYTLYNYSIAENLFLASELTDAGLLPGEVTSLSWYATNETGYAQQGISIWMANVTDEALTTTSHVTTGMTLVYTGSVTPAVGWNEFTFNEASFIWDGASNILIFCQRNNGAWNSTISWQAANVGFNAMSYKYQDGSAYDVTVTNTMTTSQLRPNIIFKGVPSGGDCEMPTAIAVSNIGPYGATVTWEGEGNAWNLRYKAPNDADFTLVENVTSPYTLTSLNYNTTYNVGVQTVCTGSTSFFKSTSFTTDNPCAAPTGLQTSDITHESATLSWSASYPTQESWIVKYKKSSGDWDTAETEIASDTTLALNHLEGNTTYNVRVYSCENEAYAQTTFTTKNPCAAPTNFVANNITDNSAVISWTPGYTTQESWIVKYKTSAMGWDTAYVQNVTTPTTTLNELAENTTYNVRIYACEDGSPLNGSFTTKYGCSVPTNLMVLDITTESANVSWTPGYQETEWTFKYWKVATTPDTITEVVNTPSIALEGLEISSQYQVRVYNCLEVNPLSGSFYTADECPNGKVCIGTGITTNGALPSQTYYKYSLSQQIYTAAEIGTSGVILSIDFYSTASERTRNMDIYMVSTDKQAFADKDDFVSVTADDLVFSGDVTFTQNAWTTIELQNYFDYDGTSNICIVVDDNTGSYVSGSNFYVFNAYANQSLYVYSDGTNYDPMNPALTTVGTIKNRIRLYMAEPTTCDQPTDLAVDYTVGTTEATLSWTENGSATAWQICVNEDEEHLIDVTTNPYTLTGLTLETAYSVKVRANCGDDQSFWSNSVSFECTAKLTIGDGSITNSYLPTYIYYLNSLTQQIYTAAELGNAGVIESIDFNCTQNNTYPRTFDIYMVSTDKSAFENTTDWINITEGDLVYSGTITLAQGWNTFVLNEPFIYDGTSNVAIIVDATASNYQSGPAFYAYPATAQALRIYSDGTNYDPFNPTQYTGTIEASKNQIRIVKSPIPTCWKPTQLAISDVLNHSAVLSWTNGAEEEAWQICLNGDEENLIDVTESPYTLTGLTPETTYTVKMRSFCSEDDQSAWTREISFTTAEACPVPTDLEATHVTATTATLNWEGFGSEYNVRYAIEAHGEVLESMDFNDTLVGMGNWTTIDADGDGYDWVLGSECGGIYLVEGGSLAGTGHNGSADLVTSGSYSNATSAALTPDNYLVSPQVTLGGTISFWACGQDASYAAEHFGVAVSTTVNDDATAFTTIWEETMTAKGGNDRGNAARVVVDGVRTNPNTTRSGNRGQGTWYHYTVDLSAYSGQGYVAIRHFNCTDMFMLDVDDIVIEGPVQIQWTEFTVSDNSLDITGLEAETEYLWQVQANCGDDGMGAWTNYATFTTGTFCDTPFDLEVADVTYNAATLNWYGSQDSYNVRYRTTEVDDEYYFYDFNAGYEAAHVEGWNWEGTIIYGFDDPIYNIDGDENYFLQMGWATTNETYIFSPELPEYPEGSLLEFYYFGYSVANTFQMGYSSTTNDTLAFTWSEPIDAPLGQYTLFSEVLPAGTKYVAFKATAASQDACIFIDNFRVYNIVAPAGEWMEATANESTLALTGLTPETEYEWQVQGIYPNCGEDGLTEWSEMATFTTLEQTIVTQTIALTGGTNWVSFNVEITLNDLKAALVEAVPGTSIQIKGKDYNASYNPSNHRWTGRLTSLDLAQMYRINVAEACEITLEGDPVDPADHPITVVPGTNWIGFPLTESMSLTNAFAGFAVNDDVIKSKDYTSQYKRGRWMGNQLTTLEPGQGYKYNSAATENRTLVFPAPAKNKK